MSATKYIASHKSQKKLCAVRAVPHVLLQCRLDCYSLLYSKRFCPPASILCLYVFDFLLPIAIELCSRRQMSTMSVLGRLACRGVHHMSHLHSQLSHTDYLQTLPVAVSLGANTPPLIYFPFRSEQQGAAHSSTLLGKIHAHAKTCRDFTATPRSFCDTTQPVYNSHLQLQPSLFTSVRSAFTP